MLIWTHNATSSKKETWSSVAAYHVCAKAIKKIYIHTHTLFSPAAK